jgi:hypothetical protein
MSELTIGQVRFLNNSLPLLGAGEYEIEATQTVTMPDEDSFEDVETQKILVRAPRYSIPGSLIHSVHPAPSSIGDYNKSLPFITLNSKQLPWMRDAQGGAECPWMALMLFKPEELITAVGNDSPTKVTRSSITPKDAGTGEKKGIPAYTIEVRNDIYQALVPNMNERRFFAHVREIDAGPNAQDGMEGKGSYSVVVSNRMPTMPIDPTEDSQAYIAHLVSMEDLSEATVTAGDEGEPGDGESTTRLVSLYSWCFETTTAGANFQAIASQLDESFLKPDLPPQFATQNDPTKQEVVRRYDAGYVALNSTTRFGEPTFAWYRGPFVPVIPDYITNVGLVPFASSDEAMIYDQGSGIFEQSYAVAWQTGRMVTLANNEAAQEIFKWKQHGIAMLNLIEIILEKRPDYDPIVRGWLQNEIEQATAGVEKFVQYLQGSFGHLITGNGDLKQLLPVMDPSGLQKRLEDLPGLADPEALRKAVAEGEDPYSTLVRLVQEKMPSN